MLGSCAGEYVAPDVPINTREDLFWMFSVGFAAEVVFSRLLKGKTEVFCAKEGWKVLDTK